MPDSVTIEPYFGVEARLMRVESGISDLKVPSHPPYPTPPSAQHERSVADKCVGGDKEERTFYLDDVVDFDWLLRAGN
ncbi:hypothetical protein B0H13DRAFT_2363472 [Mycena leptocephala]|nr:hypothetical protein B0H13DRAFT_2363472 [Mycena leptocephala]